MEDATRLIETVVTLIGALSWPLVVVFVVYYFGEPLKGVIKHVAEFSFKASPTGLEASAKIQELQENLPSVDANATSDARVKVTEAESTTEPSTKGRIDHRHEIEERNREVYLVHVIEPSKRPGQKFDVFIYLTRHRSDDLSDVRYAEFFLGRHWANKVYRVENTGSLVGISISAYGPVLCTCRVVFEDGYETFLDRYVDFEMADVFETNTS